MPGKAIGIKKAMWLANSSGVAKPGIFGVSLTGWLYPAVYDPVSTNPKVTLHLEKAHD